MRIPRATYRLQLTPDFGFQQAQDLVPYLHDLGISDLYLSPIFRAVSGSTHGYDVVDHNKINRELGGRDGLEQLHHTLRNHDMGWLQDIVPNHMAFHSANSMLMDVIENGPASRYAKYFDIDFNHIYESLRGRVLAPFLGKFYGEVLESGEIILVYDKDGLWFKYYDLCFPVRIESYVRFFTHNLASLEERLGTMDPDFMNFLGTVHTLDSLSGPEHPAERSEQIHLAKTLLWQLYQRNEPINEFVNANIVTFNGDPARPESFNLLDSLLGEQYFRLAFWKVASEEINYRRFFTINSLISLRLEDEQVFADTHQLVAELVNTGIVDSLRIDHIDGLHDPSLYLERLKKLVPDTYIVVEKILEYGENLPPEWPVAGTTGYEFLNTVNGVFCRRKNEGPFSRLYSRFAELHMPYHQLVARKKRQLVEKHLAGNIDNLAHQLKRISSRDRYGNDITLYGLRRALLEVMTYFPVYRTYINHTTYHDSDHDYIKQAVAQAHQANPDLKYELDYIEKFLLMRRNEMATTEERDLSFEFVMHFQQITGPLMAKGVEDTALYIYNRLISLNEVGGSPHVFGATLQEFHDFNLRTVLQYPHTMITTATHDTKRGEDVRARINVLSEIPVEWEKSVKLWRRLNKRRKVVRNIKVPDKNDEYFLYQALIGSWPFDPSEQNQFIARFKDYIIKAIREAKVHTAWLKPDAAYEDATLAFIDAILSPDTGQEFLDSFLPLQRRIAWHGMLNSLSQTLIKLTAPGAPDIYQGTELWDLSMVDPDNRRPVDFNIRRDAFRYIKHQSSQNPPALLQELIETMTDGRIKLYLIHQALTARQRYELLFRDGLYTPLMGIGERADNTIAFMRHYDSHTAITVVPRFTTTLATEGQLPLGSAVWGDTHIPLPIPSHGRWHNVLTDTTLSDSQPLLVAELLSHFPVALLINLEEK